MLSDIELFIVTWIFAGGAMVALAFLFYASTQLQMHLADQRTLDAEVQTRFRLSERGASRIRNLSTLAFFLSSTIGAIISVVNWLPPDEYNIQTGLYRVFSASFGIFSALLISGGVLFYVSYTVLKKRY